MTQQFMTIVPSGSVMARSLETPLEFSKEQSQIIRDSFANGATESEFAVLMETARVRRLNPLLKQIFFIKRWDSQKKREVWACQVSIDGLRAIAERTGKYDGQEEPQYEYDKDNKLVKATVRIWRKDISRPFVGVAFFAEYAQKKREGGLTQFWAEKPHVMIAKCFDDQTEVLTDRGFQKFAEVTGRVLQVTPNGLEPTTSQPFVQAYDGDMVTLDSDDLNFSVTPNHDMVTVGGKIEAGEMFDLSRVRPQFHIPRSVEGSCKDAPIADRNLVLAAAYLCDGFDGSSKSFVIEVSRPRKAALLRTLSLHETEGLRACAGDVAHSASGRDVTTKSDKVRFRYGFDQIQYVATPKKQIDGQGIMSLSRRQARVFVDAMIDFDGHAAPNGVRRFYSARPEHLAQFELACVIAGYAVSGRTMRTSDISSVPSYTVTVSDRSEIPVRRFGREYLFKREAKGLHTGLVLTKNESGKVWCVTVPSGEIVVRRNGFSMRCGNCAEALAFRKGFPEDTAGLYVPEEMGNEPEEDVRKPNVTPAKQSVKVVSQGTPEQVKKVVLETFCPEQSKTGVPDAEVEPVDDVSLEDLIAKATTTDELNLIGKKIGAAKKSEAITVDEYKRLSGLFTVKAKELRPAA